MTGLKLVADCSAATGFATGNDRQRKIFLLAVLRRELDGMANHAFSVSSCSELVSKRIYSVVN